LHEEAEVKLKKVMENNTTAAGNGTPIDIDSFMVSAIGSLSTIVLSHRLVTPLW
jgi:hypothetical protein